MTIEQRMELLERTNRRWRRLACTMAVLIVDVHTHLTTREQWRQLFLVMGLVCVLVSVKEVRAEELAFKPFLYEEGFEEIDPTKFSWSDGVYKVNFKGLSSQKAYSGKKSLKIDVTIENRSVGWMIPIWVPADEGELLFSGRIMVGNESSPGTSAKIQGNIKCEPATCSGLPELGPNVERADNKWTLIEKDLVSLGKDRAGAFMRRVIWKATSAEAGAYYTHLEIRMIGKKGDRVVVYLDDFKIEGLAPSLEDYQKEVERKWAPAKKRVEEKIAEWQASLNSASEQIEGIVSSRPEAETGIKAKIKGARGIVTGLQEKVQKIKDGGYIRQDAHSAVEGQIRTLNFAVENIQALALKEGLLADKVFCYETKAVSGVMILPDTYPVPGKLSNTLYITAAPGEYEPASFVLRPISDIRSLRLTASALKGKKTVIPASNIDIKIVKCWYQAEGAWFSKKKTGPGRVLVPELLLNDDTLVKVDNKEKTNHLKLRFPDSEQYLRVEDLSEKVTDVHPATNKVAWPIAEFPVYDAPVLQPLTISAGLNQQFWVTVRVPEEVAAGIYQGRIELLTADGALSAIILRLKVLPFTLARPGTFYDPAAPFTTLVYYNGKLRSDPQYQSVISSEFKNEEQLRRDMENFYAHGILPTVNQSKDGLELLARYLQIYNEAGFAGRPIYFTSDNGGFSTGIPGSEEALAVLGGKVEKVLDVARQHNVPEVYVYGMDEADGERLKAQRQAWEVVHKAGAKVWVAGFKGNFEAMGDILDILAYSAGRSGPDPKEAGKWHSVNHKIWNYANPQGGPENPDLYRRNYGLQLWRINYDGGGPFAWQVSYGDDDGMWNDFSSDRRANAMTYPAADRPIDTIAWEGFREAVDDVRYATTLKLEIDKAKKSKNSNKKKLALQAEKYLEELDVTGDLDVIRRKIISYILKLK